MKYILTLLLFIIVNNCSNIINNKFYNNDNWQGDQYSGFSEYKEIIANDYMISTSEKTASEVGAEILARGGTAIDSAIASQLVLNVIEPHSSGIGGGLFLLYHHKKTGKNIYFNGLWSWFFIWYFWCYPR